MSNPAAAEPVKPSDAASNPRTNGAGFSNQQGQQQPAQQQVQQQPQTPAHVPSVQTPSSINPLENAWKAIPVDDQRFMLEQYEQQLQSIQKDLPEKVTRAKDLIQLGSGYSKNGRNPYSTSVAVLKSGVDAIEAKRNMSLRNVEMFRDMFYILDSNFAQKPDDFESNSAGFSNQRQAQPAQSNQPAAGTNAALPQQAQGGFVHPMKMPEMPQNQSQQPPVNSQITMDESFFARARAEQAYAGAGIQVGTGFSNQQGGGHITGEVPVTDQLMRMVTSQYFQTQ